MDVHLYNFFRMTLYSADSNIVKFRIGSPTRSSADAGNRLDAFSGQSRSTNMVPFSVHCDFSLSM